MSEIEKQWAIRLARDYIEQRASKGEVRTALMERFLIQPNEAGRIIRTAVRELYGSDSKDPMFWLAQDSGESTPLQRRFARRRYRELLPLSCSGV